MQKQPTSKAQKPSLTKRKMAGKKGKEKVKAATSTTSTARSASDTDEESDSPSLPMKKKKSELLETTMADTERLKEVVKVKIRGGSSEDTSAPLPPLRPKYQVKKKSTL